VRAVGWRVWKRLGGAQRRKERLSRRAVSVRDSLPVIVRNVEVWVVVKIVLGVNEYIGQPKAGKGMCV
jgi:hypothetical protein